MASTRGRQAQRIWLDPGDRPFGERGFSSNIRDFNGPCGQRRPTISENLVCLVVRGLIAESRRIARVIGTTPSRIEVSDAALKSFSLGFRPATRGNNCVV